MPSDFEDFLEGMSRRLNDQYASEKPTAKGQASHDAMVSAAEEARKGLMHQIANAQTVSTTLFFLDDNPHVQRFFCSIGHLLGAVTSLQSVIIFRFGEVAKCLVCGEERAIPEYAPVGDEPADLLAALAAAKEKKHGAPEAE